MNDFPDLCSTYFVMIVFSWSSLVCKNYEIEKACLELEMEINLLKAQQ